VCRATGGTRSQRISLERQTARSTRAGRCHPGHHQLCFASLLNGNRRDNTPIGMIRIPALLRPDNSVHCMNRWTFRGVRPLSGELIGRCIKRSDIPRVVLLVRDLLSQNILLSEGT